MKIRTFSFSILSSLLFHFIFVFSLEAKGDIDEPLGVLRHPEDVASVWFSSNQGKFFRIEEGLYGRTQKGESHEELETMSGESERKIIFYMGSEALRQLIGLSGDDYLMKLGYSKEHIEKLRAQKKSFRLVIFKYRGEALPATWENLLVLVQKYYPAVGPLMANHLEALKTASFEEIERQALQAGSPPFLTVKEAGKSHPFYMDEARLLKSSGELWQLRAFLFYQLRLMELFSGDGHTRTHHGMMGVPEFIGPNLKLDALAEKSVIPIDLGPKALDRCLQLILGLENPPGPAL